MRRKAWEIRGGWQEIVPNVSWPEQNETETVQNWISLVGRVLALALHVKAVT